MASVLPALAAICGCGGGSETRDAIFYKATGSLQCLPSQTTQARLDAEVSALRLVGAFVTTSACATDGRLYPTVCGGATGDLFSVTVSADSAFVTEQAGFAPSTAFTDARPTDCR